MTHIKLTAADPYHLVNPADPSHTQCGEPIDLQSAVDTTDKPGNRPQCPMCWVMRPNTYTLQEE